MSKKYSKKHQKVVFIITIVLCVAVLAATLLVKQHALLDVAAAIPWGLLSYFIVYHVIGRRRDTLLDLRLQRE